MYNPFRGKLNQLSTDQDHNIYYTGETIVITNKCQIPWLDLINTTPAQGHHLPSTDNSIIKRKKPSDWNGIQLWCNICESICHLAQIFPEKRDLYYTQKVILFQSAFGHPEQIKNLAWVLECSSTRQWRCKHSCRKKMIQFLHKQFKFWWENKNTTP